MKGTADKDVTLVEVLSLATLGNGVVLVLGMSILAWAIDVLAWPSAGQDIHGGLLNSQLLIHPVLAVAVLIGKEFVLWSKSLALVVNALAIVFCLAFGALWLFYIVPTLMYCV